MDVIVIGFGAAGACAAIEAADAGASVLVLDRFAGGGASALSGGVVYAGGGTEHQRAAGVDDSVDAMYDYLRLEVGDAVSEETLRRFCEGSSDMIGWLEHNGVPFEGSLCPYKTSYPNDDYYLYHSGSETAGGFREIAKPAARGHRVRGPGTSGKLLFARLSVAARRRGVQVLPGTRATELITDATGAIAGVRVRTLRDAPKWVRRTHRLLGRYSAKPGIYVPMVRKTLYRQAERLERRYAREAEFVARNGVVISAGGFIANRPMVREHAPAYRGGLALGTSADDGSGIRLGVAAGGATGFLDRVTAWRFVTPPSAFVRGLIVDGNGGRVIDESRYGAAVGEALILRHDAKGWLLVDEEIVATAKRSARGEAQWFQWLQALYMLRRGRVTGSSLAEVAKRVGMDPAGLQATVDAYNAAAASGAADPAGKPSEYVQALRTPPYSLLDISIKPSLSFPCPMLTLGGLAVDEATGQVRGEDGGLVPGLYAAGRSAVGICSSSYVSGLSLADCVFSGRRAGVSVGRNDDKNENVF
ncbi:FAD-binding protein [Amycolatopsis alkalitolerans]|uniref:FAD-binding protein n=1 Tax=Amycolatopsis alkalitolerans TaxID=2547244 RepID=UPI002695AE56